MPTSIKLRRAVLRVQLFFINHLFARFCRAKGLAGRIRKGYAVGRAVDRYLTYYAPVLAPVKPDAPASQAEPEHAFSIWFQGEEAAPGIVKACLASMRCHFRENAVVLDRHTLPQWIDLPGYVIDKWRDGRMGPAHFSDICRVELLYRHGGWWFDATDFLTSPPPKIIANEPFFIYLSGKKTFGSHAFVQNCFIRGRQGHLILKAWREGMMAYWKEENQAMDYFVHQLILKKTVASNAEVAAAFARMPHMPQDPTHRLWWAYRDRPFSATLYAEATAGAFFQKVEYKSPAALHPQPGSFADVMQKMYRPEETPTTTPYL